ncbi:alanine racemase [Lacisediminihabitans sp. H27-G8]|uniref:alanine racemase n=1 Tax=Lacisediminihabitans sp. H27-G8 TaxID=3111909 RepID=UPI0038FC8B28
MSRPLREARVDLDAVAHNIRVLRGNIGDARLMTVVKSRAYGHGAVAVSRAAIAAGTDWLGVVDIAEALELRAAGIDAPILAWLHGPEAGFDDAIAADIDLGVHYLQQLDRVADAAGTASVQLKVDTGLGRNGAVESDWRPLFEAAAEHERAGRLRVRGLWSHLANAGEGEDLAQVAAFERAIADALSAGLTPELRHLAATAGALRVPSARFGLVRVGIGTYGLSPFDDASSADLGLRPALELSAGIVSVKRAPAGTGVSYGFDYRTPVETSLALVPLGYGDGIPRQASGRGPVSINGRQYRVAGRVAMDQFVVDVGDDEVAVGDRAVLFGDPGTGVPSVDDWARAADTINYEIVTRLGGRIEWTYAARD